MTPKELRQRLFKKTKPVIRRLEIMDGEQYSRDMGILWAGYRSGAFALPEGLDQQAFVDAIEQRLSGFDAVWMVDDKNRSFSAGFGPIAIVGTTTAGLIVEPRAIFFRWASKRNVLRASVGFINMLKHSKKTGIILVRTRRDQMKLPDHLKAYDMLYYLGRSDVNEALYSIRGRAE